MGCMLSILATVYIQIIHGFSQQYQKACQHYINVAICYWYTFHTIIYVLCVVSPFDPDSNFVPNVVSRLEAVMGIQIASVLADRHSQLIASSGVVLQPHVQLNKELPLPDPQENSVEYIKEIFIQWCEGRSDRLPTWVQFLDVLRSIGLTELSQQIETFLKGICTFVLCQVL